VDRIAKLQEYLTATPDDSFLQHALALEHIKLGDDAAARALFEAILEREPGYTGSYYHLGKLMERAGDTTAAIAVYERGMDACKKAGDQHALGELRGAKEELEDW
jgi:Tfp pilus assembly protein PilF